MQDRWGPDSNGERMAFSRQELGERLGFRLWNGTDIAVKVNQQVLYSNSITEAVVTITPETFPDLQEIESDILLDFEASVRSRWIHVSQTIDEEQLLRQVHQAWRRQPWYTPRGGIKENFDVKMYLYNKGPLPAKVNPNQQFFHFFYRKGIPPLKDEKLLEAVRGKRIIIGGVIGQDYIMAPSGDHTVGIYVRLADESYWIDSGRVAEDVVEVPETGPYRPTIFKNYLFPIPDLVEQHGIVIKQTATDIILRSDVDACIDRTVLLDPATGRVLEKGSHEDSRHLKGRGATMWPVTHEIDASSFAVPNYSLMTFYESLP